MSPGVRPSCFSRESRYSSSDTFSYGKKSCRPVGAQCCSQSRGQLVSHSILPSGVSTSTQWVGTSTHSAGRCLFCRLRIARPGARRSQVRSAVIAPQGRMLTVVPAPMQDLPDKVTAGSQLPASVAGVASVKVAFQAQSSAQARGLQERAGDDLIAGLVGVLVGPA